MELTQLRCFRAVAEFRDLAEAEQRAGIPRAELITQVRSLHDELGFDLCTFDTPLVGLTAAGSAFLPHAIQALDAVANARFAAHEASETTTLPMKLACGVPNGIDPLTEADAAAALAPHTMLSTPCSSGEALARLHDGTLDVALMMRPAELPTDMTLLVIDVQQIGVVMDRRHRLAKERSISWEQLGSTDVLWFDRSLSPQFHDEMTQAFERNGVDPGLTVLHTKGLTAVGPNDAPVDVVMLRPEQFAVDNRLVWRPLPADAPVVTWVLLAPINTPAAAHLQAS